MEGQPLVGAEDGHRVGQPVQGLVVGGGVALQRLADVLGLGDVERHAARAAALQRLGHDLEGAALAPQRGPAHGLAPLARGSAASAATASMPRSKARSRACASSTDAASAARSQARLAHEQPPVRPRDPGRARAGRRGRRRSARRRAGQRPSLPPPPAAARPGRPRCGPPPPPRRRPSGPGPRNRRARRARSAPAACAHGRGRSGQGRDHRVGVGVRRQAQRRGAGGQAVGAGGEAGGVVDGARRVGSMAITALPNASAEAWTGSGSQLARAAVSSRMRRGRAPALGQRPQRRRQRQAGSAPCGVECGVQSGHPAYLPCARPPASGPRINTANLIAQSPQGWRVQLAQRSQSAACRLSVRRTPTASRFPCSPTALPCPRSARSTTTSSPRFRSRSSPRAAASCGWARWWTRSSAATPIPSRWRGCWARPARWRRWWAPA